MVPVCKAMPDVLHESKLYFNSRLADCMPSPHLHSEQIKVYNQYIAVLNNSTSPEDYRQKLGPLASMFAVARAEQVDKYLNLMRLYQKLGNPDKLKAAKLRYDTAVAAQNHGDLVNLMSTAQTSAADIEAGGHQKLSLAVTLIQCLLVYMTEPEAPDKKGSLAGILTTYTDLLKLDPTFKWESYKETPYSYIVFFDAERMAQLGEVFMEATA